MDRHQMSSFLIDKINGELELAGGLVPSHTREACFHRADAYCQVLAQLDAEQAEDWRQRIREAQ